MLNIKEISKSKVLNILRKHNWRDILVFFKVCKWMKNFRKKICILGNEWMDIYKLVTVTFLIKEQMFLGRAKVFLYTT